MIIANLSLGLIISKVNILNPYSCLVVTKMIIRNPYLGLMITKMHKIVSKKDPEFRVWGDRSSG